MPAAIPDSPKPTSRSGSHLVAAGILLSRLMGLVRQKIFAHFFGNSDAGDAFYAALKIPNFLQNLLGDGVLSASFIPVYASLRAQGQNAEADRVAGNVGALLALINSAIVVVGVWAAPTFIEVIAPGFQGAKRELTIQLVQIFFPSTAIVVMSAWCLGILNSHRKFFLSYVAPVFWNLAIIAVLLFFGGASSQSSLAIYTAWGVFVGSLFQFSVQLPSTLKCASGMKWRLSTGSPHLREVSRNLVPVVIARGAVQISAYIDNVIASLLPMGAVSSLAYAQSLYMLPISLFGMSVSAAELPAMASAQGTPAEIADMIRGRVNAGLRQIAFFIVPSATAFFFLGDVIVGGLYQGGEFNRDNTVYVWSVLAGSSIGLLATTMARLYSSAFYALKDTRTPLRLALVRVALSIGLGYFAGLKVPGLLGLRETWGTVGIAVASGVGGWVEFALLKRSLKKKIGKGVGLTFRFLGLLWASAFGAALIARLIFGTGGGMFGSDFLIHQPLVAVPVVLLPYVFFYLFVTARLGIEESRRFTQRLLRR